MENDDYSAADALHDATATRGNLASRIITPWWYHPALGLILATLVASIGLRITPAASGVIAGAALVAILALVTVYRRRYRIWVGPEQSGPRSRPIWYTYGFAIGGLFVMATIARYVIDVPWIAWLAAGFAFLVTVVVGPVLDARLREDVAAGEGGGSR